MLKETETEETIVFFSRFYRWWHFSWEGPGFPVPIGYAYDSGLLIQINHALVEIIMLL